MSTETDGNEPNETALTDRIPGMTADALKAEYEVLGAEFSHLSNQESTTANRTRLAEIRQAMAELAEAHTVASAPIEAPPALQVPEAPAETAETAPDAPESEKEAETPGAPETASETESAPVTPADTGDAVGGLESPENGNEAETDTRPSTELVTASAGQPIPATVTHIVEPFRLLGSAETMDAHSLALAFRDASASGGGAPVGKFAPYGTFSPEETLTLDPIHNHRVLFGEGADKGIKTASLLSAMGEAEAAPERTSFTAAINCTGPAQPVLDIPFCYSQGRPLMDSGLIPAFPSVHGQIQIYGDRPLPAVPAGVRESAEDCVDCPTCPDLVCATHECIEPLPPIEPSRFMSCLCVPESLQWANPIVFDRALDEFAVWTDIAYEQDWLDQLRNLSVIRQYQNENAHGAYSAIHRAMWTLAGRLALDVRRNCGGLGNYDIFVPGGEALFTSAMMDRFSRVLGCDCPGEDILQLLETITGGRVVFGLDQDPSGPMVTDGFTSTWLDAAGDPTLDPALGTPQPLEPPVTSGEVYLIPRDSIATGSPLVTEIGMGERDRCTHAGGCMKLQRSEWWFPLFQVGSRRPIVLEFSGLDVCGSGPDLKAC